MTIEGAAQIKIRLFYSKLWFFVIQIKLKTHFTAPNAEYIQHHKELNHWLIKTLKNDICHEISCILPDMHYGSNKEVPSYVQRVLPCGGGGLIWCCKMLVKFYLNGSNHCLP